MHRHEIEAGHTSSIGRQQLAYDADGEMRALRARIMRGLLLAIGGRQSSLPGERWAVPPLLDLRMLSFSCAPLCGPLKCQFSRCLTTHPTAPLNFHSSSTHRPGQAMC